MLTQRNNNDLKIDLYYRHARQESLLMVGSEKNGYKNAWIKRQIDLFRQLSWRFVVIDASGDMGHPDLFGFDNSIIDRRALENIAQPIISTKTVVQLIRTIEALTVSLENAPLPITIFCHLGDLEFLPQEQEVFNKLLRKMLALRTGVWMVTNSLNKIPLEIGKEFFETVVLLSATGDEKILYEKWDRETNLDIQTDLDEDEAVFCFRGRSEGARGMVLYGSIR